MDISKKIPIQIFLADDDMDDRELFGEAIKESNPSAHVVAFNDGTQLIEHLKYNEHCDPDMIFLDINMPLKNGKECLLEIRDTQKFRAVPIIIFSTSLDSKDINDTFDGGANLFISKPGSFRSQVDVFRKVFDLYANNLLVAQTVADFVLYSSIVDVGKRRGM